MRICGVGKGWLANTPCADFELQGTQTMITHIIGHYSPDRNAHTACKWRAAQGSQWLCTGSESLKSFGLPFKDVTLPHMASGIPGCMGQGLNTLYLDSRLPVLSSDICNSKHGHLWSRKLCSRPLPDTELSMTTTAPREDQGIGEVLG